MKKAQLLYFLEKLRDRMVCEEDRELLDEWIKKIDQTAWIELIESL